MILVADFQFSILEQSSKVLDLRHFKEILKCWFYETAICPIVTSWLKSGLLFTCSI